MGIEESDLASEAARCGGIIAVEDREIGAPRLVQAALAGARYANVSFVPKQTDAGVADGFDYRNAIVRRAVVDEQGLEIAEALREHAFDCAADEMGSIVDRDEDGDAGRVHRSRLACSRALFTPSA
jgi:hypothetical protein